MRVTKASGMQWGSRLGVIAQPPLLKSCWRNLSAAPQGSTEPVAAATEEMVAGGAQEGAASATVAAEEAVTAEA
jgi:hypothetical protein